MINNISYFNLYEVSLKCDNEGYTLKIDIKNN